MAQSAFSVNLMCRRLRHRITSVPLPRMIASWVPGTMVALGTDGFGMSERREALRAHFRIDAHAIAEAARSLVNA